MTHARPRLRVLAAILAIGAAALCTDDARAQAANIAEVRRLVEAGRSGEAWPMCASIDPTADDQADLWCGIAAVDVGRAGEGSLALERFVVRHPEDVRGRLELARAYFHAGDDVASRREFEAVRAIGPPADVRAGIDRYLEALSAREAQYRTRVHGWVEAGGGHDTNVNAGVAQADISLPILGPVSVASFGVRQPDTFGWLAGSVQINHPVAPGVAIYGGVAANGQFNADASDFDIAQGAATLGASWQAGKNAVYASYTHGELNVGGDRYRRTDGVSFEWRRTLSELATASVTPQFARLAYSGANEARDADFYALGLSVRQIWLTLWQPVLNLSVVAGREENRRNRPDLGRDVYGGAVDLTVSPAPQWAINAAFGFQRSDYAAPLPLIGSRRVDDNYTASVGALYFFTRSLSARVEAQFFRNDSNFALYQYDRAVYAAKLRYDFR